MTLHVTRSAGGTESDPAVVFIHGFPFDSAMWQPQLEALPPGWRGLAPDLRGFGRSELGADRGELPSGSRTGGRVALPDEPVLTMDRMADDVAELIKTEAASPAVICGLSMGGYLAFSLWRRHPQLVRALVLADTRADPDSDEARENRARTAASARESGARPVATAMLPLLLSERTLDERPEVGDAVRDMILDTPRETLVAALAGLAARRDSTDTLSTITVPALVLVGENDGLTPLALAEAMVERLPQARLQVIPGAGHVANLENPEAFNAALVEFLDSL